MKLQQQVCSLDLARKLKELGVKQESYFWWVQSTLGSWHIWNENPNAISYPDLVFVSAFTVAELGEMLHDENLIINTMSTSPGGEPHQWCVSLADHIEHIQAHSKKHKEGISEVYHNEHVEIEDTEADARAKMLCYLLENKLIVV